LNGCSCFVPGKLISGADGSRKIIADSIVARDDYLRRPSWSSIDRLSTSKLGRKFRKNTKPFLFLASSERVSRAGFAFGTNRESSSRRGMRQKNFLEDNRRGQREIDESQFRVDLSFHCLCVIKRSCGTMTGCALAMEDPARLVLLG